MPRTEKTFYKAIYFDYLVTLDNKNDATNSDVIFL